MGGSGSHIAAWRAVDTCHAAVTERIQRALVAADLPPLSWFELLAAIERSPSGRPRMSELANWLTLSRGGITKLVDRLQEAGYIERVSCSEDRRSLRAELTPSGARMLEEMGRVYAAEIDQQLSSLDRTEVELVTSALEKITARTCDSAKVEAAQAP